MATFVNDAHSSGFLKVSDDKEIYRWPSSGLHIQQGHTPQPGDVYLTDEGPNRSLPNGRKLAKRRCPGAGRYIE